VSAARQTVWQAGHPDLFGLVVILAEKKQKDNVLSGFSLLNSHKTSIVKKLARLDGALFSTPEISTVRR
jgi:DNA integrity scanning protein DisA with diadenylate cyclase activity